jgi:D-aspartate ligase
MHIGLENMKLANLDKKVSQLGDSPVAVVVNTGDANSYGVVVNLGRAGIPVISVDSDPANITFKSRYAVQLLCPDCNDSEQAFVDFILELGQGLGSKSVLFITGDKQLMVLLKHREKLEQFYLIPHASYEVAEKLVNKVSFYQTLEKHNISHARTYLPESIDDVEHFSNDLEYPYILKPAQSQTFSKKFGNKCLKVNSSAELLSAYRKVASEETNIIVQKEIIGTERYLVYTYFSHDSKPLGICCYKKIRIFPIDFGNACVCKTMMDQEIVDLCINFLKEINYRGLAEAEIQRDQSDGKLKLVEINARSTTQSRLPEKCGVNMEYIAYQHVLGVDLDSSVNTELDVLWVDLFRDVLAVFSADGYLSNNKISVSEWVRSFRGKRIYAFFSWDDPLPSILLFWRFIKMYAFRKKRLDDIRRAVSSVIADKDAK